MYHVSARASTQDGKIAPQGAKGQHKAWPDGAVTVGKACFVSGTREQLQDSTVRNKKHRCSINRDQSLVIFNSDRFAPVLDRLRRRRSAGSRLVRAGRVRHYQA